MKEVEPAGHVLFNADAWIFNDPVVFWSVFTVVFGFCMVIFVLSQAMKMAKKERLEKERNEGGNNT
jgi:hypothetical protein